MDTSARPPDIPNAVLDDLEAQLETAKDANRLLLETLSHGLRTPLNSIIGFADMMEQEILGPVDNAQYRGYLTDINRSGRQMLDMLNDLMERHRFERTGTWNTDFRHLFELAPDLICVCRNGEIVRINPAGANLLGLWPVDVLIGRRFAEFVHDDFQMLIVDGLDKLTDQTTRLPLKLRRVGGVDVDVELAAIPYQEADGAGDDPTTVLLIARDVSERNRAISQIAARERHIRKLMDTVIDGIVTFDQNGVIETVNPAAEKMLDSGKGGLVRRSFSSILPPELRHEHEVLISRYLETEASDIIGRPREFDMVKEGGAELSLELTITSLKFKNRHTFIAVLRDVTERRQAEARLFEMATRDPLTKFPNRTAFDDRLNSAIEASQPLGETFAVLFVDLDNFRHINDTGGHRYGDRVICLAAERLRDCLGRHDTVAHMGSDEFMVILEGIAGADEVAAMGEIILSAISQPFVVDGKSIFLTASIGAALFPADGETAGELLKNVDTALHHVKRRDRGTMAFYSPQLTADISRWVEIEAGLRRSVDQGGFELMFQPKVDLESGRVFGAEALVRWQSPELGPVSPDEFVSVAEETGLILPIGDWVLREACREAARWNRASATPIHVGVNVSAYQMSRQSICAHVKAALDESRLDPALLELELTENILMDDTGSAVSDLQELRELGVSVAIDDFGTGYSSLSYLTNFPLDTLKVDRAFVLNLPDDRDAVTIASAIIGMAKGLDLHIVAEGIETRNQEGFLHAMGCHTGQGYLFSKPLTPDAFDAFMDSSADPIALSR